MRLIFVALSFGALAFAATELQKLKRLPYFVTVPKKIPNGFKIEDVKVSAENYSVRYCEKKPKCFVVESATEVGSPSGSRTIEGVSALFGKYTIDIFPPNTEGNETNQFHFVSGWMKSPQWKKSDGRERYYHVVADGVTEEQAKKIVEGLGALK